MKNLTLYPMSSYKSKIAGLFVIGVAVILLAVVKFYGPLPFIQKLDADRQFKMFFVFMIFGLFQVTFSKEKNEDERVQKIRAKSFQASFMLLAGSMIAISLSTVTGKGDGNMPDIELSMLAGFGVVFYLVLFHIGLYFDPAWNYNDDTVLVNIRKNKTFFIIYFIVLALLLTAIFLIHRS
jgi:hypothetical protein